MKIRWTEQALEDLRSIHDFIGRDSPTFASLIVEKVILAIEQLTEYPDLGRIVPEWGDSAIREIILRPYRLIYRRNPEMVEILTIFQSSRHLSDTRLGGESTA